MSLRVVSKGSVSHGWVAMTFFCFLFLTRILGERGGAGWDAVNLFVDFFFIRDEGRRFGKGSNYAPILEADWMLGPPGARDS